ncbi:MAG TPA: MG2 domain-containing protein [Capsulimonadaceae bacterium]|jgi:hypothetical protein
MKTCSVAILLVALVVCASSITTASTDTKKLPPAIDLSAYRRCWTPDERVNLRISCLNVTSVRFTVSRVDLDALTPTSKIAGQFDKAIAKVDLSRLHPAASFTYPTGKTFINQWAERTVKAPRLRPGVYIVEAASGDVRKRTWFATTNIALLAKRSRDEISVYAADAGQGSPIRRLALRLRDERGQTVSAVTNDSGIARVSTASLSRNIWIYGESDGRPAFVLSGHVAENQLYTVYATTDKPYYRPGQKVLYRGTVRERNTSNAADGLAYKPYAAKPVLVEIRDGVDTLISQTRLTTNSFGSYSGELQLSPEPPLGDWQIVTVIGKSRAYAKFGVQEYRKPEFQVTASFEKEHYISGTTLVANVSAHYFFGQPVANATVKYSVSGQDDYNAVGVTDAKGSLRITIPTKHSPTDSQVTLTASVIDQSRRTVSATSATIVTAGAFRISIEPEDDAYLAGDTAVFKVTASSYDQKPIATDVKVTLSETLEDGKHRPFIEKTVRKVTTNKDGIAKLSFKLPRAHEYDIAAEAYDSDGNQIIARNSVEAVEKSMNLAQSWPTLSIDEPSTSFKPGAVAKLEIVTSLVTTKEEHWAPLGSERRHSQAWALVTIEGEHLYGQQLVPLVNHVTPVRIPVTRMHFPSVTVNIAIIQDKHVFQENAVLSVLQDDNKLKVDVSSDKANYRPGETATYTVSVRDFKDKPAVAEVALGVVDASLYEVSPDPSEPLYSVFYGEQSVAINDDFSFTALYSGGAYQTRVARLFSPQAASKGTGEIRVRRNFADTAFWNPTVVTGTDGAAHVTFTMPDNLTAWRATARAITEATSVGETTHQARTNMPLTVRLETPRFYVQSDQAVISALLRNDTSSQKVVKTRIDAVGTTLEGSPADNTVVLNAGDQKRIEWRARIVSNDSVVVRITADGGQDAQDAVELTLPSLADGMKTVTVKTETITDDGSYRENIESLTPGTSISLSLAPSLGASVLSAVDYFDSYPYGCAEQTTSSLLTGMAAAQTLKQTKSQGDVITRLDKQGAISLQKIYRYQHEDGGWQWWEFDQTDGDMTAYVLWGLIQARNSSYLVDQGRLNRADECLLKLLKDERDRARRADWLLPLSYERPATVASELTDLYAHRDKLDFFAKASLTLALAQAGGKLAPLAKTAADELAKAATRQGRLAHWPAPGFEHTWRDDDVTTTARVLLALQKVTPSSPVIAPAIRWIMLRRTGDSWNSTRSTADVVNAIAASVASPSAAATSYQAVVKIDGVPIDTFAVSSKDVYGKPHDILIDAARLAGHHELTVDKVGPGSLYVTSTATGIKGSSEAKPVSNGFTVTKRYSVSTANPVEAGKQKTGDVIDVSIEVNADANYQFVAVEDPIPAGCEVLGTDSDQSYPFSTSMYDDTADTYPCFVRREVHDNRVVLFIDRMQKGHSIFHYQLYAQTPGVYRILPTQAYLTYCPEIRGTSGFGRVEVVDPE